MRVVLALISGGPMRNSCVWLLLILLLCMLVSSCSKEKAEKLEVGDSAPSFSLKDLDGNPVNLADMKGAPVVLRFFLTDCKYCRADTPVFNDYYTKYSDQGLRVFYIDSLGIEPKVVRAFTRELGIVFPVAQDKEGKVSASYQVKVLPQTIVLDPEHKIIAAILGGVSEQQLSQLLSPFLTM